MHPILIKEVLWYKHRGRLARSSGVLAELLKEEKRSVDVLRQCISFGLQKVKTINRSKVSYARTVPYIIQPQRPNPAHATRRTKKKG